MSRSLRTGRVLGADAARAVGRFRPEGPIGYRAKSVPDAPIRATRIEAETDEATWWDAQDEAIAPMRVLTKFRHNDNNGPKVIAQANGRRKTIAYDHALGAEGSHRAAVDAMLRHLDADPQDYLIVATDETALKARVWHVWYKWRPIFDDLPRHAQDFTYDQVVRLVKHLSHLSLRELRQRQSIHAEQITLARNQGKPDVVHSEQVWADIETAAVSLREFGEMQWSALLPTIPTD